MILGEESLTFRRYAAGARASGRYTPGTATTSTLLGSVQPATGDDLQALPEGDRARKGRRVYTETLLRTVSQDGGTKADEVSIDGEWWEVMSVANERSIIPHYRAIVLAVQEADG